MCLLLLSILVTGCATFSQRYYIEVAECRPGWSGPHSTFIRLDLSGYAHFTVSKFEKGWYDKEAVDALFSTVTSAVAKANTDDDDDAAPKGTGAATAAKTSPASASTSTPDECKQYRARRAGERYTRIYGPNGKEMVDAAGKRLVIFLTGNPNAIAGQISATLNSADVVRSVTALARRGEVMALADADNALAVAGRRQEAVVLDVETFSKWLALVSTKVQAQEARDRVSGLVRQIDAEIQGR
jgi:hypothetical protein